MFQFSNLSYEELIRLEPFYKSYLMISCVGFTAAECPYGLKYIGAIQEDLTIQKA
jgi:hypothetical protein